MRVHALVVALFAGLLLLCAQAHGACHIIIRNVTVISFPSAGGVDVQQQQDVVFEQESGLVVNVTDAQEELTQKFRFVVDGSGKYLLPAFIDSNTHLFQLETTETETLLAGLSGAVDMGSSDAFLRDGTAGHVAVLKAGPRLAGPSGIGNSEGEVTVVDAEADAIQAVSDLAQSGARVVAVKTPIAQSVLSAIVTRAEALNLTVAVKALTASDADLAVAAGAHVLQHTPIEPLSNATLAHFAGPGRAIVSTLSPYQGAGGLANLDAFHDMGGTVLYGTNLGAEIYAWPGAGGINQEELALLAQVFGGLVALYRAATVEPAAFWGLAGFGQVGPGSSASFLVLDDDPLASVDSLTSAAVKVFTQGRQQNCKVGAAECYRCAEASDRAKNPTAQDDTVEIVVGVLVPVVSLLLILLMAGGGLAYHYLVRRPKHRRRRRRALEEAEEFFEDEEADTDEDLGEDEDDEDDV